MLSRSQDDDGKETTAQRLLELYFWGGAVLCLMLLALSISHLIAMNHARSIITDRAHHFPDDFARLAAELRIGDPSGAMGLESVVSRVRDFLLTSAALGLSSSALLILSLGCVAKIVSPFEIAQVGRRMAQLCS